MDDEKTLQQRIDDQVDVLKNGLEELGYTCHNVRREDDVYRFKLTVDEEKCLLFVADEVLGFDDFADIRDQIPETLKDAFDQGASKVTAKTTGLEVGVMRSTRLEFGARSILKKDHWASLELGHLSTALTLAVRDIEWHGGSVLKMDLSHNLRPPNSDQCIDATELEEYIDELRAITTQALPKLKPLLRHYYRESGRSDFELVLKIKSLHRLVGCLDLLEINEDQTVIRIDGKRVVRT